ncbi:anillin [Bombina bombina]|uniref:anillin n=1 Tax=Bombina bombina TaxID=8345 RepID=UPI00235ACAC9|nr:anillin [Bombina bombina]
METRRQPLKRLCSDSSTESPRKRRFTVIDEEAENCDPLLSSGPEYSPKSRWHSLLRVAEQEIKPDTPAIPSVKSRIQRLHEISSKDLLLGSDGDSYSVGDKSWTEDSSVLTDSERKMKSADMTGRLDISSVLEKFEWKPGMEEQTLLPPLAQSTIAHRRPLPSQEDQAPSGETASRLRKEREDELAMVCAVLDRRNPWRAESMRQKQKKSEEIAFLEPSRESRRRRVRIGRGTVAMGPKPDTQADSSGSDFGEPSVDRSEKSLDFCEERSVSSLEVRLGGTIDSDSSKGFSPQEQTSSSSSPCKQSEDVQDGAVMSPGVENVRSQVTMDNSEFIDQLFEGVLDSSEGSEENDLDLPPMSVLSPLTKSIDLQAAISPLNSVVSSLPELLVDPPETSSPLQDSQLLYSIDAYRTLRRNVQVDPGSQLSTKFQTDSSGESVTARIGGDTKELIKLLSKDVYSLQRIMDQSCRALSCCVDAEHGKGTRQEAEAERLLLLSEEKRKALLKELDRLRGEKPDVPEHNTETIKPCHATITISDIRLPLKVDYVCSTIRESGFPSHYFLILIRFGAYDIVATPLASAADAQTGDTILFPTTVTLKDVSSDFKIEIEVYSLAQTNAIPMSEKRKTSKPKITPKKLLGSRKSTLNSPACSPAIGSILRSSNFLMVGSLTLSLESLGKFKFSLEKMKLEGKVGRILGNHFQDKVVTKFLHPSFFL